MQDWNNTSVTSNSSWIQRGWQVNSNDSHKWMCEWVISFSDDHLRGLSWLKRFLRLHSAAALLFHTHTRAHTHKSLTIHRVALSCREMCNGKDKWRIKLRWQDRACVCVCVFACVCLCVCLHVCTAQQTSKPSAHLLLMNKANSRSQGCLQIWSLFIGKHTQTLTRTHKHTSLRCLIWLSLIENRGRATFLDLTPTSVTEKVWNTISKLFLSSALQSHLTTGSQIDLMGGN